MDEQKVIDFNIKSYSKRRNISIDRYITWRIFENPFKYSNLFHFYISNEELAGQIIPIYSKFILNKKKFDCVWGTDYFVNPKYRNTTIGIMLLKNLLKDHIHFGVGMSKLSESIHLTFKEKIIGLRIDCFFLFFKIFKLKKCYNSVQQISYDSFISFIDSKYFYKHNFDNILYFERNKEFYQWIFKYSKKENLLFLRNNINNTFLIIYKTKKYGFRFNWIIDHSINLSFSDIKYFLNNVPGVFPLSVFYYSGTNDNFKKFFIKKAKQGNVVSNLFSKNNHFNNDNKFDLHLTSLDSDRFLNYFL
jgi:hypothetical protein